MVCTKKFASCLGDMFMNFGFLKVAAVTPEVFVSDCLKNSEEIIKYVFLAKEKGASAVVFPELSVTGYTCGDLFLQSSLIDGAKSALDFIRKKTEKLDIIICVGVPFDFEGKLFNCCAVIHKGKVIGIVPKTHLPNYNEFYEKRWFTEALVENRRVSLFGSEVPFGTKIVFRNKKDEDFAFSVEICEDLWSVIPPSSYHAQAGADIIFNLSAGNEITGKDVYRKDLVKGQSARLLSGYVYVCAGDGESTTDVVFSGHNIIAENGRVLKESKRFENGIIFADIDLGYLKSERRKNTSFSVDLKDYENVLFSLDYDSFETDRFIDKTPFVPSDIKERNKRCEEIITIQALGLKKRISHIGCKNVVVGISGGLDSTQALIVTYRAFEMLGLDSKNIITVTLPCFGTTDRTYNNAVQLCKALGTTLIEINIKDSVMKHFNDIGHNPDIKDLTYENSQARERTQILMDISSKYNGFVVGTGDLSELALGFATYNGDHMSMYGVNGSVPKTLIRYLIGYIADNDRFKNPDVSKILRDILDTPVSPELLPPDEDGTISQVTEDIVGPYELHDFFLYNFMRMGFTSEKIIYMAKIAFKDEYDEEIIEKWFNIFIKRFFTQQYKRSCLPDGPKVGSVSLSPRGDWRMPSDACVNMFMPR